MLNKTLLGAVVFICIAAPATADDAPAPITPAAVEQIQLVETLARYGQARHDPLLMIAAARLAKNMSDEAPPPATKIPAIEEMLESAKGYAKGDDFMLSLIESMRAPQNRAYCYGPYGTGWC